MEYIDIILLAIIIFIGIIFMKKYFYVMNVESFDNFSPYLGNHQYPFVYQKNKDEMMLQDTLRKWEAPFNCNNEGYNKNNFIPPYVHINSYIGLKDKKFPKP